MDLRDFLQMVERRWPDQVRRIDSEIDPRFEITALVTALERKRLNPVVWLNRVKGTELPVVVNVTGTRERIAAALDSSPREVIQEYLRRARRPLPPVEVATGPVKDVIRIEQDANLLELPQIVHHESDGGPYIACGIAIARDPETGTYNASFNRFMIKGPRRLGIYMTPGRHLREFYHRALESGKRLEMAVIVGVHPAYELGALYAGPPEIDEISVMGALAGSPVPMVPCETIDLRVPANAEIVIEGEVLPDAVEAEGPFGEFTGYSIGERQREVIEVKAVTRRQDALFQDLSPGHLEHLYLASIAQEASMFQVLSGVVPNLKDLHVPAPFTLFVSMKQRAEGQAKNAIFAAMAAEMYLKLVVVVDDDVDVHNNRQVLWAVGTRVQADRDIFIVPHARGAELDPSCLKEGITAKMGIDATAKPSLREYAKRNRVPREVMERIEKSGLL